ncbi:hypothetical protein IPN35_00845 [Candidatus Peregrinibacteria bacterium]|nr:MAG: hypothetical protein IPN35_00845 [Candidatus Peregrinibacteria bacterium]
MSIFVSAVSLRADFFGFWSDSQESSPSPLATSTSENILDNPEKWDCEKINGENNDQNTYLTEALQENGDEEKGRYVPEKSIALFQKNMDTAFSEHIKRFEDEDVGCDLSDPEGESSLEDHHIPLPEDFATTQYLEFRKLDCAFEAMKASNRILCDKEETMSSGEIFQCDADVREGTLPRERDLLKRSLDIALRHTSELSIAWPLHKRMQCVNESLARERELLVEIIEMLAKIQKAIPNLAQSR